MGWNPFPISNDAAAGGCFTNVSRALQNNLAIIHNTRNHIYGENFKLKLCTCAQSMALLITSTISAIHKFRENILESSWNVSETTPWSLGWAINLITHFIWHMITYTCRHDAGISIYCQTSNISCTLVGNKLVDHSDVVGVLEILQ